MSETASHTKRLTLPDLKPNQCKWPVEEDRRVVGGFLFCGRNRVADSPYCERHGKIAFAGLRPTKQPA